MSTVRIPKVQWVKIDMHSHTPIIEAHGQTPTGGYTNASLSPYVYVHPPFDGIWDFGFVIDQPDGPTTEVITDHKATHHWNDMPEGAKGVRIHGDNGAVVALI